MATKKSNLIATGKKILADHMTMGPKKQVVAKEDLIEAVLDHLEAYHNKAEAILQDYVADPGMVTELVAADDSFRDAIENIELKKEDFEQLSDRLQQLPAEDVDTKKLLDIVNDIDEDAIREFLAGKQKGYTVICVPVQTMEQQAALEAFVKARIYPNYNDQKALLDF